MKKHRWQWGALVAAMQLGALLWMAGEREWIARFGQPILLRTAPVDPRDPMRGDYVRLDYEISQVPRSQCRGRLAAWFDDDVPFSPSRRDQVVYATLREAQNGVFELESLSDQRPGEGPYLRGRIENVLPHAIQVRYGLEAYFMEQGRARAFEDEVRGAKAGVPVNVQVAVGRSGVGVIDGYAWEPLGLTITLLRVPESQETGRDQRQRLTGLKVELKNHGETPLAIVPGVNGRHLRLVPDQRRAEVNYEWVGHTRPAHEPTADELVVLAPGQVHDVTLDISSPDWFVRQHGGAHPPASLADLENAWSAWFRVEYRPPYAVATASWPEASLIRQLPLRSRAFNPSGVVD